jgi:hypothetical protein
MGATGSFPRVLRVPALPTPAELRYASSVRTSRKGQKLRVDSVDLGSARTRRKAGLVVLGFVLCFVYVVDLCFQERVEALHVGGLEVWG